MTDGVNLRLTGYRFNGARTTGPGRSAIQPEHILAGEAARALPFSTEATVEIVEPMGSDTLVWTSIAGVPVRFRVDGQETVSDGQKVLIGFDPARARRCSTRPAKRV